MFPILLICTVVVIVCGAVICYYLSCSARVMLLKNRPPAIVSLTNYSTDMKSSPYLWHLDTSKQIDTHQLAVLLISCDKYHIFSPMSLYFLKQNVVANTNSKVFYSSETQTLNDADVTNITTPHLSGSQFVRRLHYVIEKIPHDYIMLIQEDHWYTQPITIFPKLVNLCHKFQLDQLKLLPISSFDITKRHKFQPTQTLYNDQDIHMVWAGTVNYPLSHHATIFNRNFLLHNLEECMMANQASPWQHETYNFKYRNDMKQHCDDSKSWRVGYLKKSPLCGLFSVVRKGKLKKIGYRLLQKYQHISIAKSLLHYLPKSSFK